MRKHGYLLLCFLLVVSAFFVGRATISTKTKVEYKKGEELQGSIPSNQLKVTKEETTYPLFLPYKLVIFEDKQIQVIDTAAIIANYEKKRSYSLTAFDDQERGKLELYPVVQYNTLQSVDWKFKPVTKVEYRTKKPVFQPFLSLSWSTLDYVGVGGGLFYHNLGLEYQYQKGYSGLKEGHTLGLKWKF